MLSLDVGNFVPIKGTMKKIHNYLDFFNDNLEYSAENLNMNRNEIFQRDNDPKGWRLNG